MNDKGDQAQKKNNASSVAGPSAPGERENFAKIQEQAALFHDQLLFKEVLNGVPDFVMILNDKRQVVYANQALLTMLEAEGQESVWGLRPGEMLGCINSSKEPGGCGTSDFCRTCGAVKAILSALKGEEQVNECRILRKNGDALDLRVWATPLPIKNINFTLFSVQDVSNEMRRRSLERIFFHDLLNTTGIITTT